MDNFLNQILQDFSIAEGELEIDGVSSSLLATDFGTPFLSMIGEFLRANGSSCGGPFLQSLNLLLREGQSITRSHSVLSCEGCGLEIASSGEFFQAIDAGCSPWIFFCGTR